MKIHEQLSTIQANLKAPKNQKNTFGNYNYRSCEDILEAVKPHLQSTETVLIISDEIVSSGGKNYIKATATLSNADGEKVQVCGWAREADTKKGMDDSQITGATSSYARKYALNGLFLIDDTKDADTNEQKKEADERAKKQQNDKSIICPNCKKPVKDYIDPQTGKVLLTAAHMAARNNKKYGVPICADCAKIKAAENDS